MAGAAGPQQLCIVKEESPSRKQSLSELPDEVLAVLMGHVPLQQRLVGCARLSVKFRKAAAAVTTSIKHHAASLGTVYGLQAYLQSHGAMVLSLDLKPPLAALQRLPFALQRLPCPALLKLQLTDTLVQLTAVPGSQQPGILSSCTALTSLRLLNCNVLDVSQQLGGLSVLQDLQELVVRWDTKCSRHASQPLSLLPGSLLSQLVCLTRVDLSDTMRFDSLQHLGCLTALQRLRVVLAAGANHGKFSGIHQLQHLTSLRLDCEQSKQNFGVGRKYTPDLYQVTTLQELDVYACKAFRPNLLKQMSSLRDLIIRRTTLPGGAAGTSALMQVLPCLTAVTWLDLTGTLQHPAVRLKDYNAVACLQSLGVLVLSDCVLPSGLWRQLAETCTPMPSVVSLDVDNCTAEPLDTDGLSNLVKCFPSLTSLYCVHSTQPNIQWKPLQQLSHLLNVHISGVRDEDAPVLTSLQHLSTLQITGPSSITDLGLLKLTALSRLERLHVSGNLSDALAIGGLAQRVIDITNQAPAGQVPDVAKQLLRLCIRSSMCQPVLLEQLEQHAEAREHEVAAAAAEVTVREAECAARSQRLDRRCDDIIAREQDLERREQRLKQAQREERSAQQHPYYRSRHDGCDRHRSHDWSYR